MVIDASLLSTQHYKVRNKSKVKQSMEMSSALGVVAIEKGAFGSSISIGKKNVSFNPRAIEFGCILVDGTKI